MTSERECGEERGGRRGQWIAVAAILCFSCPSSFWSAAGAQSQPSKGTLITGVVKDPTGAAIQGVQVALTCGGSTLTRTTDNEGQFSFDHTAGTQCNLALTAPGFSRLERKLNVQAAAGPLNLALSPEAVTQRVTVTATRTAAHVGDTAPSVITLSSQELNATPALTLDDALRQVPGFSLLRRSGSRAANPTSQGVSLRGTGASGASRGLVIDDGIPLNDPFGGWVYWDRIPREAVSQVEVLRGGASDLYGTGAMGGVINFIPRRATTSFMSLETSYGNEITPEVSWATGLRDGQWDLALSAEGLHTDGYLTVPSSIRGPVDAPAGAEHFTADLTLGRHIGERARVFGRSAYFHEFRENGKVDERNQTRLRQLAAGADWQSDTLGAFSARIWGGPQVFDQTFFAVALDRSSEALTRVQRVPAQELGYSAQWSRTAGVRQTLVAGADGEAVRGSSDELVFTAGPYASAVITPSQLSSAVGAGGRQSSVGAFGEDIVRLTSRWIVTLSVRVDNWGNYDALRTTRPLAKPGLPVVTDFPDRTEHAFSPRLSTVYKLTPHVSLAASGYRAFRAPTLNELYRSFRLGNILTLADNQLLAEHLTGGEAGARFSTWNDRFTAQAMFFWADITRPISNVTLSVTPTLITRERENLGRTGSRGVEIDAAARLAPSFELSGGYQFADAAVVSFPANMSLEGLLVPLVPRHEFTFQARYSNPRSERRFARFSAALIGRAEGREFEDDQNQLPLNSFFTMDAEVSRGLPLPPTGIQGLHDLEVFFASENLTGQRYPVGRTPVTTLGQPALFRIGLRLNLRTQ